MFGIANLRRPAPLTVLGVLLAGLSAEPCPAELQPAEVAIVAARGNRDSEGLAGYYARMRGVPPENICLMNVPAGELCQRDQWRSAIRPEIQKWLHDKDPQQKIRCLVTVWGVPLKIGPTPLDALNRRCQQFLQAERGNRFDLLGKVLAQFEAIAPDAASADNTDKSQKLATKTSAGDGNTPTKASGRLAADAHSASGAETEADAEITRLQMRLEAALQAAQARTAKLTHEEERGRANGQLQQLVVAAGGLNVLLPALGGRPDAAAATKGPVRSEYDTVRGRLLGFAETKSLLEQTPIAIDRDVILLALVERIGGLISSIQWLDQELDVLKKNETGASFDSELALVMWPDDYQLVRWQPNYLRPIYSNSQLPKLYRTLMVSRIDAPTLRLAKGLIDTAIDVEKKGLRGKVYIDARGLAKNDEPNPPTGSYADFDRGLLQLANAIDTQTNLEVVVENTPQLFQPGQCKNAALYCGWYSLGKYVDAFEWTPGAVGYHLASAEAATLRDPNSQVWCKKMLEHGVCATIGPVYEPYLVAFPHPQEFFSLLLRGELTLVECYSLTNPFNSWMMTLIGDPLYRPFKYRALNPEANQPKATSTAPKQGR